MNEYNVLLKCKVGGFGDGVKENFEPSVVKLMNQGQPVIEQNSV